MIAATRALLLGTLDLARPRVFSVMLMGIGLTLLLFVGLQGVVFWGLSAWGPHSLPIPWLGLTIPLGNALSWGSLALFPVLGLLLGAPVAAAFSGLFTDRVASAVEAAHGYPQGHEPDFVNALLDALVMLGATLLVTLLVLLLSPFLGPLAPLFYYGANGWLLGREFLTAAARRHVDADAAAELRRRHAVAATLMGSAVMVLLTVPVLNIAAPVLAAAAATHLFRFIGPYEARSSGYPRG